MAKNKNNKMNASTQSKFQTEFAAENASINNATTKGASQKAEK
ncbi:MULTISPECIES: hypothetical protein [Paenibacillus]|nr:MULTISPECIES: hypothetical protein [Paenibacillus]SFI91923.1 hypothetical protein SAMN02799624_02674 [Paenibacillus sp. UNC496MF]